MDDFKGVDENGSYLIQTLTNGMTDNNNNTQANRTQINVFTTKGLEVNEKTGKLSFDNKKDLKLLKQVHMKQVIP